MRAGAGGAGAEPGAALGLEAFARELAVPNADPGAAWHPRFVRLAAGERGGLRTVCDDHRLVLVDTMDRQLADLAAVRLPSAGAARREAFAAEVVAAAGDRGAVGTWIWLPWEGKVVHLLGREDYFAVVTDRNRDKLTREELTRLRTKRVGVIGLSVGGEAAVTIAQEHLCGTIVLADFDRMDLSNLNRLNAGFDELGLNKSVIVARRIARIDPYLDVRVFPEGIGPTNVERFLEGLDLLVEECDGLAMKYEVRRLAKERGLNVVFAADERGFLSVEPHAHRPDLPAFHGRIEGPQPPRETFPTPLAFMRALTEWMGGWDRISERSRRSLEAIGTTLCGYPQLASEARYAAGQIGHVARRLLLGEELPPFFGHLDLDELVPTPPTTLDRGGGESTPTADAGPTPTAGAG